MRRGLDISNWQGIITAMRLAASGHTNPQATYQSLVQSAIETRTAAWMEDIGSSGTLVSPLEYVAPAAGDVSCWRANGFDTMIIRASLETAAKTQLAQQQLDVCIRGGMDCSVYGWVYWDWDPIETMRGIADVVGHRPIRWLWWDMEEEAHVPNPAGVVRWIKAAIAEAERLGFNSGIYTGLWWYNAYLRGNTELSYRPLWDAVYSQVPFQGLYQYGGWDPRMVFAHQFSSSYQICGRELDANGFSDMYYQFPVHGEPIPAPPPNPGAFDWSLVKPLLDSVYNINHETILKSAETQARLDILYEEIRRQGGAV